MGNAIFYLIIAVFFLYVIYLRVNKAGKSEDTGGHAGVNKDPSSLTADRSDATVKKTAFRSNEAITEEDIRQMERDRILNALKALGCSPEVDEVGNILVKYQGEKFVFRQRGYFITILDLPWGIFEDISREQDYLLKNCANFVNYSAGAKIQLSSQPETNNTLVETTFDFHMSFNDSETEFQEFLTEAFSCCFSIRNEFMELYHLMASEVTADNEPKASGDGAQLDLSGKDLPTDFGNVSLN